MPSVQLAELTRDEIGRAAPDSVALLPVGAIEQHGPHLPVGVDFEIVTAVARAAALQLRGSVDVLVAPRIPYGIQRIIVPIRAYSRLMGQPCLPC